MKILQHILAPPPMNYDHKKDGFVTPLNWSMEMRKRDNNQAKDVVRYGYI